MTIDIEKELRATLATRSTEVIVVPDPYPATARRIVRARRRRAVTGAALALSLIAAVPVGLHLAARQPRNPTAAVSGPLAWPARGSLAGDTAFVGAVRRRTGGGEIAYAGDDGRHRAAVVFVAGHRSVRAYVLYGASGASASTLRKQDMFESAGGALDSRPIVWYSPRKTPAAPQILLIVGPPDMREVRLSAGVTFRPDGTPHRDSIKLQSTQGAVLTEVRDLRSPELKARIGDHDTGLPSVFESGIVADSSPGFQATVATAVRKAAGQVDLKEAMNLLNMTAGELNVDAAKLTYRFWWGGRVAGHTITIATVSAPGTPTFRLVDIWRGDGSGFGGEGDTKGARFTGAHGDPLGWTAAGLHGSGPATAAVWVPGKPGVRVQLRLDGRPLGERPTDRTGLAVFPTTMTENQLSKADYRVLNDHGGVMRRGDLGLGDFSTAFAARDW